LIYSDGGKPPAGWTDICEATVTFTLPADYNPVQAAIESIDKAKQEALTLYQSTVARLNDQLAKFLSLEG
jgi:hypothetical protein